MDDIQFVKMLAMVYEDSFLLPKYSTKGKISSPQFSCGDDVKSDFEER